MYAFSLLQVYVQMNTSEEELNKPFERSQFYSLLDRYQNTINILVNLPTAG